MDHELVCHFPALRAFRSSRALEASPLYRRLRPEIERVLGSVLVESPGRAAPAPAAPSRIRATAWNIERGIQLDAIARILGTHPAISTSDVLLLTELDHGMARSANRPVARELGAKLKLHVAFAPSYLSLVKGSGLEVHAPGDDAFGIHGNAVLSRHPVSRAHSLALPNGIDLMRGKEKRLGSPRAVVAVIEHPLGPFRAVSVHLDAHCTRGHRHRQMRILLDHLDGLAPRLPVLIGGDWNTSTYNSRRAVYAILGYWRRVFMGVRHVIRNHYPYPDRYFERRLFAELEARGYRYRDLNEPGGCTFHYDVESRALNTNLGDWIPGWCFWFIRQALKLNGGRCSLKLDWFAARGLVPALAGGDPPRVLREVHELAPVSDHDPIVVDLVPEGLRKPSGWWAWAASPEKTP